MGDITKAFTIKQKLFLDFGCLHVFLFFSNGRTLPVIVQADNELEIRHAEQFHFERFAHGGGENELFSQRVESQLNRFQAIVHHARENGLQFRRFLLKEIFDNRRISVDEKGQHEMDETRSHVRLIL